jgi:hypothetical protein
MNNQKIKPARLTLIEMERKLLQDSDGTYRQNLLQQIKQYQQWVKTHLAVGLPPTAFSVYDKLKQALDSALEVITNFK